MTNDEAIEILDSVGEGRTEEDWFAALDMGIAALEKQERMQRELKSLDGIAETCDKMEKALAMACDKISCLYCVLHDYHPCEETHEQCVKRKIQYFKKKAGIEVSDNDE